MYLLRVNFAGHSTFLRTKRCVTRCLKLCMLRAWPLISEGRVSVHGGLTQRGVPVLLVAAKVSERAAATVHSRMLAVHGPETRCSTLNLPAAAQTTCGSREKCACSDSV